MSCGRARRTGPSRPAFSWACASPRLGWSSPRGAGPHPGEDSGQRGRWAGDRPCPAGAGATGRGGGTRAGRGLRVLDGAVKLCQFSAGESGGTEHAQCFSGVLVNSEEHGGAEVGLPVAGRDVVLEVVR